MEENFDEIDPEAAGLAFEALQPELDQLDEVRAGTTDRRKAINHAASVGRAVKQPEVRAEFESMPGHRFDMQHVDRLETAALATWFVAINLQDASVLASGAKLSDELLSRASILRQRMRRVLEYNADHLADVMLKLADIRGGNGYIDMADDLMRLARLYDAYRLILELDVRHYQADDAASAKRLSQAINQVLGDGRHSDAEYWNDYMGRAWTFLVTTYEEVAAAGRWLFRDENGEARFPSLYSVGRQPRRSRRDDDEGGALPGDEVGSPAPVASPVRGRAM